MTTIIPGSIACILLMVLGCTDSLKAPRANNVVAMLGCLGIVAIVVAS
jgi:hypothetical protein